jgi:hypothetical protein
MLLGQLAAEVIQSEVHKSGRQPSREKRSEPIDVFESKF